MQHRAQDGTTRNADEIAAAMQASCIGVRVGRLHRLVGRRFDQALRPLGLSISQMEVLSALVIVGSPVKPSDLAGWLVIERSTMSRNLALMERHGLVQTTETSATGRSQRVAITDDGLKKLADASTAWQAAQDDVRHTMGRDAAVVIDGWLNELIGSTQP